MRLQGKVAFVSGGAQGMGASEARLFAKEGAKVGIGDVLEAEGRKVEAEINEAGGEALFLLMDVTSESDWKNALSATVARFGKLDILVNNAGVGSSWSVEDTTEEEWDRVMDINGKGVFLGTKLAIPEMRKTGGGSIVNISSLSALVGQPTVAPPYNASKAAVHLLTKGAAVQYGKEGIRVNSVHPGPVATPMTGFPEGVSREDLAKIKDWGPDPIATIPMRTVAQPQDIAYGVLFLASDEASYVTGAELVIDGGFTTR